MLKPIRLAARVCMFVSVSTALSASTITLDFESFPDSTILTNQYPDLTFSNAIILTAGLSLNEFEFPPHSGVNVVSDNGGPITISFAIPINSFSSYFSYVEPLTIAAFNSASAGVASATSRFSSNDALFGDPGSSPNELIQVSFPAGISSVTITGDPGGGSFVLDDVTITTGVNSTAPEPASLLLLLSGVGFLLLYSRMRIV
jgi:hypothetical protein